MTVFISICESRKTCRDNLYASKKIIATYIGGYFMNEMNRMMLRLAQAYVPFQVYVNRWDPMKGLMMGTIFPELYRPYYESMRRG
jgi:hypothetical protein